MQATVEIPNNYLNDTMIKTQTLFGQTKNRLIVNEKTISKNVYERLFINFYNSLVMANENTEERILNVIGAPCTKPLYLVIILKLLFSNLSKSTLPIISFSLLTNLYL